MAENECHLLASANAKDLRNAGRLWNSWQGIHGSDCITVPALLPEKNANVPFVKGAVSPQFARAI